jgi:hypothetical protein
MKADTPDLRRTWVDFGPSQTFFFEVPDAQPAVKRAHDAVLRVPGKETSALIAKEC